MKCMDGTERESSPIHSVTASYQPLGGEGGRRMSWDPDVCGYREWALSCVHIVLFYLPQSCPTVGGGVWVGILPSYLDAGKTAARVVPEKSTTTVDQRQVRGKKNWNTICCWVCHFYSSWFSSSFILFLFLNRITHIIGETCFVN